MASSEKGNLSTDIGNDVIEEALRSVEKRRAPAESTSAEAEPGGVELDPTATGDAAAAEAPEESSEVSQLRAQLAFSQAKGRELMEKIKDEHERMLRAVADLENFKKRAAKEKEEVQRFGSEKLLKDFLPVIDNLDRALDHAKNPSDFDSLVKGIKMTRKIFEDTLGRHGVKSFSAVGQAFDPRLHEAMQQQETSDMPPNHVFAEVLRGYTLNERLVRPALVMVSKAPAAAPADGPATEGGVAAGSKPESAS